MEPNQPSTENPIANPAPGSSIVARMFNVFATPGEVFDEVKDAPPATSNWLGPIVAAIVVGIISVFVIFSQPAVLQGIHDQQTKAMDDKVKSGAMTQAQADQAEAIMAKYSGPAIMEFSGIMMVFILVLARVFWWALVLWLIGKFIFKAAFSYQQAMGVAGLASTIVILGAIVTTLLSVMLGKFALVNLALLAHDDDPQSTRHVLLSAVDLFDLWMSAVMALGLARLAGVTASKAFSAIAVYWLVIQTLIVSVSIFFIRLSHGFK